MIIHEVICWSILSNYVKIAYNEVYNDYLLPCLVFKGVASLAWPQYGGQVLNCLMVLIISQNGSHNKGNTVIVKYW